MKSWELIPMREFSHLCIIRAEGRDVIATVHNDYAVSIQKLPELLSVCREFCTDFEEEETTRRHEEARRRKLRATLRRMESA